MSAKLENAHTRIVDALVELEPLFKHHKLTFVARNLRADMDADVVVSEDDLDKVAEVLLDHARRGQ